MSQRDLRLRPRALLSRVWCRPGRCTFGAPYARLQFVLDASYPFTTPLMLAYAVAEAQPAWFRQPLDPTKRLFSTMVDPSPHTLGYPNHFGTYRKSDSYG